MFFDSERERNEVEEKMTLILLIDFKTKEIQYFRCFFLLEQRKRARERD